MMLKNKFSYHGIRRNYTYRFRSLIVSTLWLDIKACNLLEYININKEDLHNKLIPEYRHFDKATKDIIPTVKIVNHAGVISQRWYERKLYSQVERTKPKWIRVTANHANKILN